MRLKLNSTYDREVNNGNKTVIFTSTEGILLEYMLITSVYQL